jgi:cytochrome c biogenesis protein CcmG/thiol:disulfide interchange protein DsbE
MTTKHGTSRSSFSKIVLLVLCFVLPVAATADLTPPNSRKLSPGFNLTDSTGASVKLSGYKGKVVLLDFWATWCGGCKVEIPWYMEFQNKYRDKGLSVVGVSMDEDGWKSVKPFLAENNINYPIVIGNSDLGTLFGVTALPVTLLIDRNGKIAESHAGMVDKDAFESEIQVLLKETGAKNVAK